VRQVSITPNTAPGLALEPTAEGGRLLARFCPRGAGDFDCISLVHGECEVLPATAATEFKLVPRMPFDAEFGFSGHIWQHHVHRVFFAIVRRFQPGRAARELRFRTR